MDMAEILRGYKGREKINKKERGGYLGTDDMTIPCRKEMFGQELRYLSTLATIDKRKNSQTYSICWFFYDLLTTRFHLR